jgi:hypothetical protein
MQSLVTMHLMHCVVFGRRTNPLSHAHALQPGLVHEALVGSNEELHPTHSVSLTVVHVAPTWAPMSHWVQGMQFASEMLEHGCKNVSPSAHDSAEQRSHAIGLE